MGKTYWMLVTTQENLDITRARGFSMQGVDTKNRKKAVRMGPKDRVLYYVSDKKGFAATATVTSDSFEDEERIWNHHRENEMFPHRVEIDADVVLDEPNYVDGFQVGPTLEYVKKWPPHLWPHAFFGMLHIIPQRDFNFIEAELRRASGEPPAPIAQDASESLTPNGTSMTDVPAGSLSSMVDSLPRKFSVARKSRKSSHRRRSQKRN